MSSSAMYAANRSQQTWSNPQQLRKQRSFVETTASSSRITSHGSDSNRSRRGSSANRSGSVILARLPSERNKFLYLQKQRSIVDQVCAGIRGSSEQRSRKYSLAGTGDKGSWSSQVGGKDAASGGPRLAWTNSTFDCDRLIESGTFLSSSNKKDSTSRHFTTDRSKKSSSSGLPKSESKINLSINLTQTIKLTENDAANSDPDSSSESADNLIITPRHSDPKKTVSDTNKTTVQLDGRTTSAAQRRALFQSSRGEQLSTSTAIQTVSSPKTVTLSASPSLIIQKRPPLVRAMSAPVRSIADTTKNLLANTKRKTRRRRVLPRNPSCDKGESELDVEVNTFEQSGKKLFSRTRSTVASDIITLVSLASSEGSESEKEESGPAEECQTARAPSLRKTGKSVSFQENEQSTFQMAVKEFPHMLRRGSIAPLAARIRANRPPTAPPGSIFRSDFENCTIKMSQLTKLQIKDDLCNEPDGKENNVIPTSGESPVEFDYPDYVRSIKERECWKLFKKMSKKGVNVTYDTILRGMLTPTEFRQLQKQREIENAKNQEAEDREVTANNAENKILVKSN